MSKAKYDAIRIAKQLGYNSLQVFYNEYKKYLPNGCDIDLLEDIFSTDYVNLHLLWA